MTHPPPPRYTPTTGCAATAERRQDPLYATAPPAERWLLIELNAPWPRAALTALTHSTDPTTNLPAALSHLCTQLHTRPVLIRRHGRTTPRPRTGTPKAASTAAASAMSSAELPGGSAASPISRDISSAAPTLAPPPRRWFLVDSRPGHESIRTGLCPTDEHLLQVLTGADQGTLHPDPIYLVCTHGRHDACCAVRGRPAAAALTAAYPDRTWECSHIGGDRFAANLVFLPESLFYGHVPATEAVPLAEAHTNRTITPAYYRGNGALPPPAQAAQHFAREAGHPLALNALTPIAITQPAPNRWSVTLQTTQSQTITVALKAEAQTINAQLTCATQPPGHLRHFTLAAPIRTNTS
ncbi:sucrase ferredoxin [Kribbella sp. NPDC051770]|uniref:sucrase ferredoxin n=1 Tax=Kribbella sp. NPDC051770 TaxID=3155413 RepID=UPI00341C7958